jgi:hypothetical protein
MLLAGWTIGDRIDLGLAIATFGLFAVTLVVAVVAVKGSGETTTLAKAAVEQAKAFKDLLELEERNGQLEWSAVVFTETVMASAGTSIEPLEQAEVHVHNAGRTPAFDVNLILVVGLTDQFSEDVRLMITRWGVIGPMDERGPSSDLREIRVPREGALVSELVAALGDLSRPNRSLVAWKSSLGTRHLARADGSGVVTVRESAIAAVQWAQVLFR